MCKSTCLVLITLFYHTLFAQTPFLLKKTDSIVLQADEFAVDAIGYVYSAYNDVVEKRDTSSKLLFRQSTKMTGHVSSIDVTNPLKPLLFFQSQQAILFTDNTLTPYRNLGYLPDLGVSYATLVCYSEQFNRFWIYDQDNSRLTFFSNEGEKVRVIENLSGLIELKKPCQLLEKNGILYMVDENRGVYLFDMFGTLVDFIEIEGLSWIQADEHNIYYLLNNEIYSKNIQFGTYFSVKLPRSYNSKFRISKNNIYLKSKEQIDVFEINLVKKRN